MDTLICVTALAMAIRNAAVRKLAVQDLTTTVLTLKITGLVADWSQIPLWCPPARICRHQYQLERKHSSLLTNPWLSVLTSFTKAKSRAATQF
jgi:hypothetical protein